MIPRAGIVSLAGVRGMRPALLLVALALPACQHVLEPADRVPLDPPEAYRVWWDATRACVGQPAAEFDRIRWWTATDQLADRLARGMWVSRHDIYLRPDKVATEAVVRHEMVHDLLQTKDHDSPLFRSCVNGSGGD